jgi:NADPH-dependent curcumin reductase CurA
MLPMALQLLALCFLTSNLANGLVTVQGNMDQQKSSNTIPKSYRALVAQSVGESFSEVAIVKDIPTPYLSSDEALIRVTYAGVNGGCETFRARGEHAFIGNAQVTDFGLGAEGVGVVVAVGSDVTNVEVGDAVCFVGSAFAEYSKCKASTLWNIPEPLPEYVGLRISGLTACAMLEETGKLKKGEKVLITAAAGGAGHFAVQFAKLAGCEVCGTCGSDAKAEVLKRLGCDKVINYKTQDVNAELKRFAPDGLDVVLEGVGGKMFQIALQNLEPKGRLLQIGYISEYPHNPEAAAESSNNEVNASELFWKSQTIQRGQQTIYGNAWPKDYNTVLTKKDRVLGLFAEGKLQSIVDETATFEGLDSVSDAIEHMLSGKTTGKVVVKL